MTRIEIRSFIAENYSKLSNRQLADSLGIKLYAIRGICYKLGLKRMELEYFTIKQVVYLKKHYQTKGDSELAEIFQKKWPKQKGWTKKHIEKKRKYLELHRTKKQIKAIHLRNVKAGRFTICPIKAWNKRGRAPDGEIHYWRQYKTGIEYPVIKHNGRFVHWGRWAWEKKYGSIPKGMNVVFKKKNPCKLTVSNLLLLSDKELAKRNSKKSSQGLSDNYIAGLLSPHSPVLRETIKQNSHLLEIKRKQLTLNRIIYERQIA